jgi:hypothetical protein
MDAKFLHGNLAGIPVNGSLVNINTADAATLVTATTKLAKTLIIGAGVATVGMILLSALMSSSEETFEDDGEPTMSFGCSPIFFRNKSRRFWGIILDDELEFEATGGGGTFKVPFDLVSQIRFRQKRGPAVSLVDGSMYRIRGLSPKEMSVATLAGKQTIYLGEPQPFRYDHRRDYEFRPPRIKDLETLRDKLKLALTNNEERITEILGQDVVKKFFHVPES